MAKKHILDIDEQTWRDIRHLKIDRNDPNVNTTLVLLIKRGMVRTMESYLMTHEETRPPRPPTIEPKAVVIPLPDIERSESSVRTYEHLAEKERKTPTPKAGITKERASKINERLLKEMREKYDDPPPTTAVKSANAASTT